MAFMFLFILVIAAFIVGFHSLYWYYYPNTYGKISVLTPEETEEMDDTRFGRWGDTNNSI